VKAHVTPDTLFGSKFGKDYDETSTDIIIVGVQKDPIQGSSDEELGTYFPQLYHAPGAIVDYEVVLPELFPGEFIQTSKLIIDKYVDGVRIDTVEREETRPISTNIISFSVLFKNEGTYEARIQLNTNSNRSFVKKARVDVIDTEHICIKVYKIRNNGIPSSPSRETNNYVFGIQNAYGPKKFTQYIPAKLPEASEVGDDFAGVKLNHVIVLHRSGEYDLGDYITNNYYETEIGSNYVVCISKEFGLVEDRQLIMSNISGCTVHSSKYSYIPQNHDLEEICGHGSSIHHYMVDKWDALCVVPELKFGKKIEEVEWEFENVSKINSKPMDANNAAPRTGHGVMASK
jgi:hypothetical protein